MRASFYFRADLRAVLDFSSHARPAKHLSRMTLAMAKLLESLEKLTEKANTALAKMEELRKKLPDQGVWTDAADQKAWDESNKDYDETTKQIDEIRSGDAVKKKLAEIQKRRDQEAKDRGDDDERRDINDPDRKDRTKATDADSREAFHAWVRVQSGLDLTKRQKESCQRVGLSPRQKQLRLKLGDSKYVRGCQKAINAVNHASRHELEPRAMTITDNTGGELIGRALIPQFEQAMLDFSGVLQACEILRTNTGEPLDWPTVNDSGNEGALLAINTQAASNVDPATEEMTLDAYKYTSKIVLVPTEFIEDDSAGFVERLPSMLGERLGRAGETAFTNGTGSAQPNGIITAATAFAAASATAFTADEVIGLEHSVDPAYRTNAAFMMHDTITKALRILKDAENRYLWQPGLRDGKPDQLLGYRVFRNQKMDSALTTGKKLILFGDLSKYKVRMVRNIRFYRMTERYRDYDQDGFVAFVRMDGDLLNAGVVPVKVLTLA